MLGGPVKGGGPDSTAASCWVAASPGELATSPLSRSSLRSGTGRGRRTRTPAGTGKASLTRPRQRQGKREEARGLLGAVEAWLTEGFETADLKEVKAVLDELASPSASRMGARSIIRRWSWYGA